MPPRNTILQLSTPYTDLSLKLSTSWSIDVCFVWQIH